MFRKRKKAISFLTVFCFIVSLITGIWPAARVQAAEEAVVIDLSHQSPNTWGYTFGTNDEVERWQTFTTAKDGRLDQVGIYLLQKGTGTVISDLVVELYATANGKPTGNPLKKVTVPLANVSFGNETKVNIGYDGLAAGKTYAVSLTQATLALNGTDNCYQWPTKNIGSSEHFGKAVKDANGNLSFVDESFLGTGWLKVYTTVSDIVTPVATTVQVTSTSTVLKVGETTNLAAVVKDQNGNAMENQTVTWSSNNPQVADINQTSGVVTAKATGSAVITATCGTISGTITITVGNPDGTVTPTPGMVITQDTKFAPGEYDFSGKEGIVIGADNITVDGNGAILRGGYDRINTPTSGQYEFYSTKSASEKDVKMSTKSQIDFTGKTSASLEFDTWYDIEEGWDSAMVQVSEDGQNWTSLSTSQMKDKSYFDPGAYPSIIANLPGYTGKSNGWLHQNIDLSAYAGKKIYLQFRYMTDWGTEMQGIYLDSIKVTANGNVIFQDSAENGMNNWNANVWAATDGKLTSPGYFGTGIKATGHSGVTVKNMTVKGFNLGLYVGSGSNWTIENNDFSNNFTDPSYGWGDPYDYGAVMLEGVNNSTIKENKGNNVWTGLFLKYSNNNTVTDNDFSHTSNVCLKMWNASNNTISDNNMSYGIRIDPGETHARDSTSLLMESGSNNNKLNRNDFTHGGDGIFIRVLNGWPCTGNYFEENDASYANNNAIESWAPGNTYIRNKANHSSYGFWLGGSDNTVLIGNEAAFNGRETHNAPEAFGNAGISIVNGESSHVKIIGNYIHDNYGPGMALRYDPDYPAYHYVIQNNIIENNLTSTYNPSYKGYGIYLKNAKWLDIAGNTFSGNSAQDIFQDSNVSDVFVRQAASSDVAPTVKLSLSSKTVKVGQEVTFDASQSSDPNGTKLGFRWELGDGTLADGSAVNHTFNKAGFYRVGVTVNNGKLADLAFVDLNVVDEGAEIGTEAASVDWQLNSNGTSASKADDNTYYVDGSKSIFVNSNGSSNKLVYPKSKDANLDFSKAYGLSFNVKFEGENKGSGPIIRIYQDASNYLQYTPSTAWLDTGSGASSSRKPRVGEYRTAWIPMLVPFAGSTEWTLKKVGNPSISNINYIEIEESNNGMSHFWLDGLKTVNAPVTEYAGSNLTVNTAKTGSPAPIYSSKAQNSNEWAPLSGNTQFTGSSTPRWTSGNSQSEWYGVDLGTARYVNRLDVYLYNNPTGTVNGDTEVLPQSYEVQYKDGDNWKPVNVTARSSETPQGNLNRVYFDKVLTSQVRVVVNNAQGKVSSIYALQAVNTGNIVAQKDDSGKLLTVISSNVVKNATLKQVEIYIGNDLNTLNDPGYSDYEVTLYKTGTNGMPTGSAISTGELLKSNIQLNTSNKINMTPVVLEVGKQYAVVATQKVMTSPTYLNNHHYRWPTRAGIAPGEKYGKVVNGAPADESFLGTGWLKVYTDKDTNGSATIDYSFSGVSGGFGLGHQGEDKRFQTFTMPKDPIYDLVDGSIKDGNGWSTSGSTDSENWVEFDFNQTKQFNEANVYFDDNSTTVKLPQNYKFQYWNGSDWADAAVQKAPETPAKGFNTVTFDKVSSSKFRMMLTSNEGTSVATRELELMYDSSIPDSLLSKVDIKVDKSTLFRDETSKISISGLLRNGETADLSKAEIKYASSNPESISVDNGVIKAGNIGMAAVTASVTLDGITVESNTINVEVTTNIASIRNLLNKFNENGDIDMPMAMQLKNSLDQAEHQMSIGHRDNAIKHVQDFVKHIENGALDQFISKNSKNVLDSDSNSLIKIWQTM